MASLPMVAKRILIPIRTIAAPAEMSAESEKHARAAHAFRSLFAATESSKAASSATAAIAAVPFANSNHPRINAIQDRFRAAATAFSSGR
jgi:hypothetical protein